jgi:hypothetical protein
MIPLEREHDDYATPLANESQHDGDVNTEGGSRDDVFVETIQWQYSNACDT